MMRGAALCLVLLLAVGMTAGQGATPSPSPAPEEACTVKEADLSMVNWAPVKSACAVPAPTRATTNYTTYCNTCICSMSTAIQTGLAAKSIVLTAAQRDSLLTACTTEFLPILMDDTKANLTTELGDVAANCGDYAATAKSCPAVNTTSTNTTTNATVPSPSPSTGGGAREAPAPGVTPVPPPKNSALPLAMSILALAAAVVLQVLLA